MVNDSVREELALKISPIAKTVKPAKVEIPKAEIPKPEIKEKPVITAAAATIAPPMVSKPPVVAAEPPVAPIAPPPPPPAPVMPALSLATTNPHTSEISSKATSPTLIEFQTKNAVLPEWRLQLQNSVRRRNGNGQTDFTSSAAPRQQTVLVTKGATALKAETVQQPAPAAAPPVTVSNPTLAKALQRIEASRQTYYAEETPRQTHLEAVQSQPPRTYPHAVPNKPQEFLPKHADGGVQPTPGFAAQKPRVAAAPLTKVKIEKFDTKKLPPIPMPAKSVNFEKSSNGDFSTNPEINGGKEHKSFQIKAAAQPDAAAYEEPLAEELSDEEMDDRAPVSLRFNAGLFDLIIGSFLSVILLAPFMLSSGNLFTLQGLFAFLATCSIVMFIYLTTTIGTMGRTLGMRLFSLELVDIEENAYPTFHQAAVNSSVYLVSLALGGVGFLTLFFNHEKRAAHDLLSGTIVVREYE